jgi:RHS repeat-associated protein
MRGTASVTLAYDNADRRTSLTLPNGIVVEYAYDDDSRLTGLTYTQGMSTLGTLTYGYDANGQRTSVGGTYARTGLPAALASATYDDANQIATLGGTAHSYDATGNLTSDGTRTYTWNARNQLVSLTGPVNATFAYDGVARRRSKTVGGTTTQFLYDLSNPVQELAGGAPIANLLTGGLDEFFARMDSTGTEHYLGDALGSSIALVDSTGALQTEYTYEPFGTTATGGSTTTNSFAFTGREMDNTGLYYYRARYYDTRLQRFTSDPIRYAGGLNLFQYAANNPCMYTDPLGLEVRNCSDKPIYIKPEEGPAFAIPPHSEWGGGPDGVYVGPRGGGKWTKVRTRPPLPQNDVTVTPGGEVVCTGGPCRWIPAFRYEVPEGTWEIPPGAPFVPTTRPLNPRKDCPKIKG